MNLICTRSWWQFFMVLMSFGIVVPTIVASTKLNPSNSGENIDGKSEQPADSVIHRAHSELTLPELSVPSTDSVGPSTFTFGMSASGNHPRQAGDNNFFRVPASFFWSSGRRGPVGRPRSMSDSIHRPFSFSSFSPPPFEVTEKQSTWSFSRTGAVSPTPLVTRVYTPTRGGTVSRSHSLDGGSPGQVSIVFFPDISNPGRGASWASNVGDSSTAAAGGIVAENDGYSTPDEETVELLKFIEEFRGATLSSSPGGDASFSCILMERTSGSPSVQTEKQRENCLLYELEQILSNQFIKNLLSFPFLNEEPYHDYIDLASSMIKSVIDRMPFTTTLVHSLNLSDRVRLWARSIAEIKSEVNNAVGYLQDQMHESALPFFETFNHLVKKFGRHLIISSVLKESDLKESGDSNAANPIGDTKTPFSNDKIDVPTNDVSPKVIRSRKVLHPIRTKLPSGEGLTIHITEIMNFNQEDFPFKKLRSKLRKFTETFLSLREPGSEDTIAISEPPLPPFLAQKKERTTTDANPFSQLELIAEVASATFGIEDDKPSKTRSAINSFCTSYAEDIIMGLIKGITVPSGTDTSTGGALPSMVVSQRVTNVAVGVLDLCSSSISWVTKIMYMPGLLQTGINQVPSYVDANIEIQVRNGFDMIDTLLDAMPDFSKLDLQNEVFIEFVSSDALGIDGPRIECISRLIHEMTDPAYNLFVSTNGDPTTGSYLQPRPLEYRGQALSESTKSKFLILGRLIGLAIRYEISPDIAMAPSCIFLIQQLANKVGSFENEDMPLERMHRYLALQDPQNSLTKLTLADLPNDIFDSGTTLTAENLRKFVEDQLRFKLIDSVKEQIQLILLGLADTIKPAILRSLTRKDFETIIVGSKDFNVQQLIDNTSFDPQIKESEQNQFIKALKSLTPKQLEQFMFFVSGSPKPPLTGFESHATAERKWLHVLRKSRGMQGGEYPVAQVCFRNLFIKNYRSIKKLREFIIKAIEFTGTMEIE